MSKKQQLAISFFLTRALFLGGGLSNIFSLTQKDSWLAAFLGIAIGIIIIFAYYYLNKDIKHTLKDYLQENKLTDVFIKIVFYLLSCLLIILALISLTTLLASYFLTSTPSWFITIPFILIVIFNIIKKEITFYRVIEVLFPICLFVIILKTLLLSKSFHIEYFLPIFTASTSNIFKAAAYYALLTSIPLIYLIDNKKTLKDSILFYLVGSISSLIIIISVISVLGPILIQTITFPEYAVLRKIEFLNFIENIENVIANIWLIDLYVLITTASFNIKKITNTKMSIVTLVFLCIIFNTIIIKKYSIIIFIYKYYIYALLIILLLLIMLFTLKKHNN